MNIAVIGIGSNINPFDNIKKAKKVISSEQKLLGESKFVKTKPVGFKNQPDFINGAFLIETDLELKELRAYLKNVEIKLGRKKSSNKFTSRTIDLDIIVWNNTVIDNDFYEREFVRNSVKELLPEL
jgi:2-amino-4-hydroxy-6-hydroxymethyldihydropteridine diphosphokinase